MDFVFEKDGVLFEFKSPKLDESDRLMFSYRIKGIKENEHSEDGFCCNAKYNEKIYKGNEKYKNVITFPVPIELDGKKRIGVILPEPHDAEINNLYKKMIGDRERVFDDVVTKIIKGEIPISFKIVGCDYPHYQPWLENIPEDLKGQEQRLMYKAIDVIYEGKKWIDSAVGFLKERLNHGITIVDSLNDKAFNIDYNEKTQKYHGYKETIVTHFDIKLMDILEGNYEKFKESLKKFEEKNKFRDSMEVEILNSGRDKGSDGDDFYVEVLITDKETKENLKFNCRNVFDVGYIINPCYEIVKGLEGGLRVGDTWETFEADKGWFKVRDLTEFEKKCLKYLSEFPPIATGIRL